MAITHQQAHKALCDIIAGENTMSVPVQPTDQDGVLASYINQNLRRQCPLEDCEATVGWCSRCDEPGQLIEGA